MYRTPLMVGAALLIWGMPVFGGDVAGNDIKEWIDIDSKAKSGIELSEEEWRTRYRLLGYMEGLSHYMWVTTRKCEILSIGQLIQATKNYVEEHPDEWGDVGVIVVRKAVSTSFPCYTENLPD